ncbi:hypothetical protein Q4566_10345 [Tamlana sp. 2_MG-2023]|uniref:hypothetical protein n=1 Tax=unclassified Tamlana TaxID=2614803 RepID=UPI0026E1791B|nr:MULTISPECIES: hypothetical protein [unclassified Tamlana]MDO6760599.1 hypothetical protein [Tamlana sp. 2_MG-2023]MDO6790855.1 hypothetical protein [Tamlana sp. 1_MG-2023]
MPERLIEIKEVALNNNCPECYNTKGLHLLFKQKVVETSFYKAITPEIKHELNCKTCETAIYPEQWTDDIDRVVDYQKKVFEPKSPLTKLKTLSWSLIIGGIALIGLSISLVVL